MDQLSNLLVKIQNAYKVRKEAVTAPMTKLGYAIAQVLVREGYLDKVEKVASENQREQLVMTLRYNSNLPAIGRVRRISRPGRRVYCPVDKIPRPIGGFGTVVLSTSNGIMTAQEAKKKQTGGEVLFEIVRGAFQ